MANSRLKLYNFALGVWTSWIEGDFIVDNMLTYEFPDIIESYPLDHYISDNGEFRTIVQRFVNSQWVDTNPTNSILKESSYTGSYIKLDEKGLQAFNGAKLTLDIDSNGNINVVDKVTAKEGYIADWNIVGSTLRSLSGDITLNGANNTIMVGTEELSVSKGIIATKGKIAGWTISGDNLQTTNMTLTGGNNPQITVGSNITLNPTRLTINNGAIDITSASGALKLTSTGLEATKSANEKVTLNGSGLTITGGAINITTGYVSATKNMVINANGITAYADASNYVQFDSDGVKVIKAGNVLGSAITKDGIIGTLLTDQSVAGSKFDKVPPAVPTIVTAAAETKAYVEQTATSEFINIQVTFNAVTDSDREGYKVYLKEGPSNDNTNPYIPVAVIAKSSEVNSKVVYHIRGVKSNTIHCVRVSAYDVTGNESALSTAVQIAGIKDTVAPKAPAAITVLPGFKFNAVTWTAVTQNNDAGNTACVDLDYYEVERAVGPTFGTYSAIAKVYTDFIIDKGVNYDTEYKYRIRAVDKSGNASGWTVSAAAIPSRVDKGDIVAKSITTELLNIGSIVKSINREQTTLFHFDGTLMSTQGLTPFVGQDKVVHQNGFFKRDAKFGASLSIEEDTENLISTATNNNAAFKGTTNGWTISPSAIYKNMNGVDGIDDGYLEVPYDWNTYVDVTVVPGKPYTVSAHHMRTDANSRLRIDIQPLNGDLTKWNTAAGPAGSSWADNRLKHVVNAPSTSSWTRSGNTFTVPAASTTTRVRVFLMQQTGAGRVAVDSVQLEQREYSTSFFNGIKSEGFVNYYAPAIMNHITGGIAFWAKNIIGWHNVVDNNHPDDSPYVDNWFIWGRESSANKILAKYNRENSTLTFMYGNTSVNYKFPASITNDSWIHFACTWESGKQTVYINGEPVAIGNGPTIGQPTDDLFRIGYFPRVVGGNVIEEHIENGVNRRSRASLMFDEFRVDKVVQDLDEIRSWYKQDTAFYDAGAQIDADSQNISAANASVTINNEGITVRDGKIAIESEDGKILLKDGRIQVNGLDVGVPQSENGVYNGNFTIQDSTYSISDTYLSQTGMMRAGAKYWQLKRFKNVNGVISTSKPLRENVLSAATWNKIPVNKIMDPDDLFNIFRLAVGKAFHMATSLPPASKTSHTVDVLSAVVTPRPPVRGANGAYIMPQWGIFDDGFRWNPVSINTGVKYLYTDILDKMIYDKGQQLRWLYFDIENARNAGDTATLTAKTQQQAVAEAEWNAYKTLETTLRTNAIVRTAGIQAIHTAINEVLDLVIAVNASTQTAVNTRIQTLLVAGGISDPNFIGYCQAVAAACLGTGNANITAAPEYQIRIAIANPANGLTSATAAQIDMCRTAGRNSFAYFISTYDNVNNPSYTATDDSTRTMIQTELQVELPKASTPAPMIAGLIALTQTVIVGMKQLTMASLEQKIDEEAKQKYKTIVEYEMGQVQYNNMLGDTVTEFFEVGSPASTRPNSTEKWNHVHLHQILGVNPLNPDLEKIIHPRSGLPVTGPEYTGDGTSFRVYPLAKKYGRDGYAELSVQGPNDETVQLIQDVPNLTVYTDGTNRGHYFKQHIFTFNANWATDDKHNAIKDPSGRLLFEVEELVATKKMLPRAFTKGFNPLAPNHEDPTNQHYGLIQSGTPDLLGRVRPKTISDHFSQISSQGHFMRSPSHEFQMISSLDGEPGIRQCIVNNFVGNPTNGYVYQSLSVGNSDIDIENKTVKLNTVIDALTMSSPNGYLASHPMGAGYVKDGVLYFGAKVEAEIDTSKKPEWTKVEVTDKHGSKFKIIKTNKKGDFLTTAVDLNTNCDAMARAFGSTDNGTAAILMDWLAPLATDLSHTQNQLVEVEYKDFRSGFHTLTLVNTGIAGMNTSPNVQNPGLALHDCKMFDYESLTAGTGSSENITEYVEPADGMYSWNPSYIVPKYANSLKQDGTPILPCMTPVKYRVKVALNKSATPDAIADLFPPVAGNVRKTIAWVTGIQAELGTNPSYTRLAYGSGSISGYMIQAYDPKMFVTSGIQSRHFEEHRTGYPIETGIQSRHLADGQVTSDKIANGGVTSRHIAKSNITFDKTRIRTDKLMYKDGSTVFAQNTLTKSNYDNPNALATYISIMGQPNPNILYVNAEIAKGSEFVIKNGQILDLDDDYTMSKHIAFVDSKDLYDVANELDILTQNDPVLKFVFPKILDSNTAERPLNQTEAVRLVGVASMLDMCGHIVVRDGLTIMFCKYLKQRYNVLYCTKIVMTTPLQNTANNTDKIKIQFWEEL